METQSLVPAVSPQKSTNVRPKKRPQPPRLKALRVGLGFLSTFSREGAAAVAEHLFLTPTRHARPAHELGVLATARHLLVPTDDGALAAWQWGVGPKTVLLVHGWEGRGAQLGPLVEPLVRAGLRVVAFDAPGHGSSPGNTSSLVHFARAIERVAHAFGPIEAVITHSMGGASLAWAFRNGPFAERVVMLCPPTDMRDFTRQLTGALALSEEVREQVHQRLERRLGVAPAELRVSRIGPRMTTPLLVIHDEDDREVPIACGELVAQSWPGATLVRTRGLGHRRILKDPDVIAEAIRFITQTEIER